MRISCTTVLAGVVALLMVAPASAADQTREGFWFGVGLGWGSADGDCDGCPGGDREGSGAGFLKLGGTLSDQLLVGAEVNAWTKDEPEGTLTLGNLSAAAYYYPNPSSGFFVKAGLGSSTVSIEVLGETLDATGWGLVAGAGYDWRVGNTISLTPAFNFYMGQPGDLKFQGTTILSGWSQNVFDISVGVTFH